MKKFLLVICISTIVNGVQAQIRLPESMAWPQIVNDTNLKLSEIDQRFNELRVNNDSLTYSIRKEIDRWYYEYSSRIHVNDDSTYDITSYKDAYKQFVESTLYCNDDDRASWENIGPFEVGQTNGWISAVYRSPLNPI